MAIEIRKLEKIDSEEFWHLRLRGLKENPEAFGASYEEALKMTVEEKNKRMQNAPEAFVLGGFADQKLVGVVGFQRGPGIKTRHKAYIWGMYVAPEGRGQGVAKQLMLKMIELGKQMSALEQLTLSVVNTNLVAAGLYRLLGFKVYGTEPAALKIDEKYHDEDLMYLGL